MGIPKGEEEGLVVLAENLGADADRPADLKADMAAAKGFQGVLAWAL